MKNKKCITKKIDLVKKNIEMTVLSSYEQRVIKGGDSGGPMGG